MKIDFITDEKEIFNEFLIVSQSRDYRMITVKLFINIKKKKINVKIHIQKMNFS